METDLKEKEERFLEKLEDFEETLDKHDRNIKEAKTMSFEDAISKTFEAVETVESLPNKVEGVKNSKLVDEEKEKRIQEKEQEVMQEVEQNFEEVKENIQRKKELAREKIQDFSEGEYDKRSYYSQNAAQALQYYDNPVEYLQQEADRTNNPLAMKEKAKQALIKARATGHETESIKNIMAQNMAEEEYKARKKLRKAELLEQNIDSVEQTIKTDLDKIKEGNFEVTRTSVASYLEPEHIDKQAENSVMKTIR